MKTFQQITQQENINTRERTETFFKDYEGKNFVQKEHGQDIVYNFQELKFHSYKGVILVSAFVTASTFRYETYMVMNEETKLIPINIDNCYLLETEVI